MAYAAPPYDMWQLGCLLYNLATLRDVFGRATVLFNKKQLLKDQAERESLRMILDPYSAEEFLLYAQTEVLGAVPRDVSGRGVFVLGRVADCAVCRLSSGLPCLHRP
jgi:hypothetical protein